MNVSLKFSGQTSAELQRDRRREAEPPRTSTRGSALISVRRFRATQPDSPSPTFSVRVQQPRRVDARREAALQRLRVGLVQEQRATATTGTIFESFDEISAIVSATPRLVPIDCAIS